ncbi:MAG: M48 family metalloprotease [Pirellulales bacterium]|nr:M48 family metalloprotease [Pirellulales bacterium]
MWEQIERNRRRSRIIVTAMGMILVGVGMALGMFFSGQQQGALVGGVAALGIWLVLWLFSHSQGDDVLLRMAHARQIEKRDHPQLYNIVEEMSIAAQLPKVPRVFIVDDPSPNAFAVGRDPQKAAVAVTIGLLRLLDRDELQGVVAHEIGHIKNRDVALMTTAGIMLGAIVILADIGLRVMWYGGGSRRSRDHSGGGGGAQVILMLIAAVFLILSPILVQLIYFALSRRREYLADASGAMYTRWPEGLASALEKLGMASIPQADQSRVTAPMYIVRPLREGERRNLASAFSTHPPLEKRIQVLRGMGGNVDFQAYDRAYSKVLGDHVVGARTLAGTESIPANAPADLSAQPIPPTERLRAASDAFLAGAGYQRVPCHHCGAVLKIPKARQGRLSACPRCGASLGR